MRIAPYKSEDLNEAIFVELPDTPESRKIVSKNARASIAFTAFSDEEKVLFIGGLSHMWGRVYEVWVFTTKMFYSQLKTSLKAVKQLVAQMENIGYSRIQADVRADLTRNISFIQHFGFKYESTMLQYGYSGETYLRFVRLEE